MDAEGVIINYIKVLRDEKKRTRSVSAGMVDQRGPRYFEKRKKKAEKDNDEAGR